MDDATIVVISTTFPDSAAANACAERLVGAGLAACAQVEGPVSSTYRWEGRVERAEEWRLVCKTSRAAGASCREALEAAHPYDLPQLVWLECRASAGYAAWVERSTGGTAPQAGES